MIQHEEMNSTFISTETTLTPSGSLLSSQTDITQVVILANIVESL